MMRLGVQNVIVALASRLLKKANEYFGGTKTRIALYNRLLFGLERACKKVFQILSTRKFCHWTSGISRVHTCKSHFQFRSFKNFEILEKEISLV